MDTLHRSTLVLGAFLVAMILPGVAVAKGPLAAIEISGPAFDNTLVVTEGDALADFDPWAQAFLGRSLEEAPDVADSMTVTMLFDRGSGVPERIYRFTYVRSPSGGTIYLPGPGDPDYDLNKTTILSANDGRWFEASAAWDAFYEGLVRIQPPSTGSAGLK